ncbi:MAG: hypothetical protein Kow0032_02790 [Methyloligellaceae bacterium]
MVSRNLALRAAIERLRDCSDLEIDDALALAETSIRSLTALAASHDASTQGKLQDVASKVARLKSEIAHLQAHHLSQQHIPETGRELDATVAATEEAATRIMECAEAIMEADASDPQAYMEAVNAQVMQIFEACAFQDITGQRISKARENLDSIGTRVSRFASALGTERDEVVAPASEAEKAREERKRKLILNGPAAEGEGVNQDEIDALLNS